MTEEPLVAAPHIAPSEAGELSLPQQERRPRIWRALLFTGLLLLLLAGVFVGTILFKLSERIEPKPSAIGGPFSLVSTAGKTTTEKDLVGHWTLIYFGYTYCPDACPTALTDMGDALQVLGNRSINALFITVDPERDTASALGSYLTSFDPRIVGLTGSRAETSAAAAAYHVLVEPQKPSGEGYLVDHSAYVHVMDPQGRFVDVIDGAMPGKQMAAKVSEMMERYL